MGGAKATRGTPGSGLAHGFRAPDSRWHAFQAPAGVFHKSRSDPYSPAFAVSAPCHKAQALPATSRRCYPPCELDGSSLGLAAWLEAVRRARGGSRRREPSLALGRAGTGFLLTTVTGWLSVPCARPSNGSVSEHVKQKIFNF